MAKVDINNTIEQIAVEIAHTYNLKPFPKVLNADGYLIFAENEDANSRGQYGHLTAARMAAIVPYVAELYKKHKEVFKADLKQQIDNDITPENIKLLQIIVMLRSAGRWHAPNLDPLTADSKEFAVQSSKECAKFLQQLGVNNDQAQTLAKFLVDIATTDNPAQLSILPAILGEAVNLVENSQLKQDTSPFYQHIQVA